jgi:hypothetical protein
MLAHPTLDLLHALGLHGMAKGFREIDANPRVGSNTASGSGCCSSRR